MIVDGANNTLSPADVQRAESSLLSGASVVVCQLEVPLETTLAALKAGKKHGGVSVCVLVCVCACLRLCMNTFISVWKCGFIDRSMDGFTLLCSL